MPDGIRELAIAMSLGSAPNVALKGRFRWSEAELTEAAVQRSVAEVIRDASSAMVAQANLSKASVLSILKQD